MLLLNLIVLVFSFFASSEEVDGYNSKPDRFILKRLIKDLNQSRDEFIDSGDVQLDKGRANKELVVLLGNSL